MSKRKASKRAALPRLVRLYVARARQDIRKPRARIDRKAVEEIVVQTAYHEAAHAVVDAALGDMPILVTVERGSDVLAASGEPGWGFTRRKGIRFTRDVIRRSIRNSDPRHRTQLRDYLHGRQESEAIMNLAGPMMDWLREDEDDRADFGDYLDLLDVDGHADFTAAHEAIAAIETNEKRRWCRLYALAEETKQLLQTRKVAARIRVVAERLLSTPTLEGDPLDRLLMPVLGGDMRRDRSRPGRSWSDIARELGCSTWAARAVAA